MSDVKTASDSKVDARPAKRKRVRSLRSKYVEVTMKAERPRSKIVVMPEISWGLCRRRRCGISSDLADGLCVDHWDRTISRSELDTE